jgi:GTP pyrophosphokinase
MIRFDDVLEELVRNDPEADVQLVRRAYVFSAAAHRGQTRRNGEPYLIHPLEVSYIVAQLRLDQASVCAALLHDTVEDTVATTEQIQEQFGDDVAFLVDGVTKLEKFNFTSAEEAQAENFRKMLIAMSRDLRVVLLKLADRLHNMRTLGFLREEKQKRIARETLEIYAPLAHRLGINWLKTELEDLSFKHLFPEEYKDLAERIKKTRRERERYIEKVIGILTDELAGHGIEATVTGRPKHLWSIRQKIKTSGRPFEKLFDILAFRVFVHKVAECYEALGLVHSTWKPVPGRFIRVSPK